MPLDRPPLPNGDQIPPGGPGSVEALRQKAQDLNARLRHHSATDVLRHARDEIPRLALVSSFGADSVALLHLTAMVDRSVPVVFIDTQMLFAETLVYQQELAERLGLRDLRILRAEDMESHDPDGTLHRTNPDLCCQLRKTAPLDKALTEFDGWITGMEAIVDRLNDMGVAQYALTNLPAEKWSHIEETYSKIAAFDAVVVSGAEKMVKPDPRLYQLTIERMGHAPEDVLFIDDREDNVRAGIEAGFKGHVFRGAEGAASALRQHGLSI